MQNGSDLVHTGPFTLVKWYMDCVTNAGDAAILYLADLRWRGLHASMGSVLENGSTRTSMGRFRMTRGTDEIRVGHARLKVSGSWQALSPAIERTVYEGPAGCIVWNCMQPGSRVRMLVEEREFIGLGYAECLTLALCSWRLPIQHLGWGRFVSPDHSLAWVDWRGEYSTRFAAYDGRECSLRTASESEVLIEDASLKIERGDTLREGPLNSTVLGSAPALKKLFPASLFNIREQKWKSRGTLTHSGGTSHGWVIHEVVDWEP